MIAAAILCLGAGEEEFPRTKQLRVEVGLLRVLDVLDLDVRVAAARGADTVPREVDPRIDEGRTIVGQCRRRQVSGCLRCSDGRRRAVHRGRLDLHDGCRAGMTGGLGATDCERRRLIEAQHLRVVCFAELGFRKLTQVEVDGPVRRVRADTMRIELLRAPAARAHRTDDLMALLKQKLRSIQSQKAGDTRDKHSHDDFSFLLLSWFFAEPGKF